MLLAAIVYIFFAEIVRQQHQPQTLNSTLYFILAVVAAAFAGTTFLVRQNVVASYAEALRTQPDDPATLFRWFSAHFVIFALAEAVALFGFLVRVMGATAAQAAPFYAGGIILLLLFTPQKP